MYYLVELLDIPCITMTPLLVKCFVNKYKKVHNDWFNDPSNIFNRIDYQI